MVYRFFDKKTQVFEIKENEKLVEEIQKPIIRKF